MKIIFPKTLPFLTGLISFVLLALPTGLRADAISEWAEGIYVEEAFISAAQKGGTATLRLKITNFGLNSVYLLGVNADFAKSGRLVINVPGEGPEPVRRLVILEEETLDLASSHLKGELNNISADLIPGTNVDIELIFSGFTTSAEVHVHDKGN